MKKQTKLFAILLTLALIIGVFAVAASAYGHDYAADAAESVTGENIFIYAGFQGISTPYTMNTTTSKNVKSDNNKNITFSNGYAGTVEVVQENGGDNKYVETKYTATGSGSGFLSFASGNAGAATTAATIDGYKSFADLEYQMVDFDVYFPDGKMDGNATMNMELRGYTASSTTNNNNQQQFAISQLNKNNLGYSATAFGVKFETVDGVIYATPTLIGSGNKVAIDANQWAHVSVIIRGVPTADARINLMCYVAVNGVIISSYQISAPAESASSNYYDQDMTNIFFQQARWNFGSAKSTARIDNIAVRAYDNIYDDTKLAGILEQGVGADLTGWERNAYDPTEMPFGDNPIAKIEDTNYPNLAAAIAAATSSDIVELLADTNAAIVVKKPVTIQLNGNKAPNISAPGLAIEKTDDEIIITKSNDFLTVEWYECDCGNGCIEEETIEVYIGGNIYEAYKIATGHYPVCQGEVIDGGKTLKKHVGFEDLSEILGEEELKNIETFVVTEDLLGENIELSPIYEDDSAIALRTDANGNEKYIFASQGFNGNTLSLSAGVTIQLLADVRVTAANKLTINNKDVTFDLNGHKIISLSAGSSYSDKYSIFTVKADGFTIKSSELGGAIYHATKITYINGNAVVSGAADDITVYFEGQNEKGETTLSMYASFVFLAQNNRVAYDINGGHYIAGTAYDNSGLFYARTCAPSYTIKDAYFDGGNSMLAFGGANQGTYNCNVNVTNCVFGSTKTAACIYTFAGLKVNFDSCYFGAEVNPRTVMSDSSGSATAPVDAKATYIFKNCFIKSGVTVEGTCAEGQAKHEIAMTKEWQIVQNTWDRNNWDNENLQLALGTKTITMSIDAMIADANLKPVEVEWYAADGETLIGQNTAMPASYATAPKTAVEGTEGYVVSTYRDWVEDTYIPLGTTGPVKFTLKEGAELVYEAGNIGVMFNFDLVNHFQYNFYIPETPEGITYTSAQVGTADVTLNGSKMSTDPATGIHYYRVNTYPGMSDAASKNLSVKLTFDYNGQTITYESATISVPKYAMYIFQAEKYKGQPIVTAMADMIRVMKATSGVIQSDALKSAYAYAEENKFFSSTEGIIDTTVQNDFGDVNNYIDKVEFIYTKSGGASFSFNIKEGYVAMFSGATETIYGAAPVNQSIYRDANNQFHGHNLRAYAMKENFVISIYKLEDVKTRDNGKAVYLNEGATVVASATFNIQGIMNADTGASAEVKAFYEANMAYAVSSDAYMQWRHEVLGKAPKYQ